MKRYNYLPLDGRARRITWVVIAVIVLATAWMSWHYLLRGGYYPAWFLSLALAVAALYVLSIPRSIRLTDTAVEIRCVVELVTIAREDIRAVRPVDAGDTRLWLLLGSFGFFGYYGYYLDRSRWEVVRVYATRWENLVEIEDIYDQKYLVNDPGFLAGLPPRD